MTILLKSVKENIYVILANLIPLTHKVNAAMLQVFIEVQFCFTVEVMNVQTETVHFFKGTVSGDDISTIPPSVL